MLSPRHPDFISIADYLRSELSRDNKHEYLEGQIYAMAGASKNHQLIISNLVARFVQHLKGTPCDTYASDMKARVGDLAFFYPDVVVACQDDAADDYYIGLPTIIVEVLSNSTRRRDKTTKFRMYQTLPSLQEYVLIEQDIVDVEVCRRSQGWVSEHYFMGD
jgi:Uma2 family endonuclease